jgi:hypothetical protein
MHRQQQQNSDSDKSIYGDLLLLLDYLNRAVIIPLRDRKTKITTIVPWGFFFLLVSLSFFPFINLVWNTTPQVSDQSFDKKIFPTRPRALQ